MASLYNIHLRTGCFCNTGACQKYLSLSNKQVKDNLSAGHVCGDDVDLIEGQPTGSVRISFGYMSSFADAKTFLNFIEECFLESDVNGIWQHGTSYTHTTLHSGATLLTNLVLFKHSQGTATSAHHKNSVLDNSSPSNLLQDLTVQSTPNQKDALATRVGARMLDDCQVYNSGLLTSVDSLHHSKDLRLEKICLYPIKSCAAFEVIIKRDKISMAPT